MCVQCVQEMAIEPMPMVTVKPPTGDSGEHGSEHGSVLGDSRNVSHAASPRGYTVNAALMRVIEEAEHANQAVNVEEVLALLMCLVKLSRSI